MISRWKIPVLLRRSTLLLVTALIGVGIVFVYTVMRPEHDGQSLHGWLDQLTTARDDYQFNEAVRSIRSFGPDALPALGKLLRARDDDFAMFGVHSIPAEVKRRRALAGLSALGPPASSMLPELSLLLDRTSSLAEFGATIVALIATGSNGVGVVISKSPNISEGKLQKVSSAIVAAFHNDVFSSGFSSDEKLHVATHLVASLKTHLSSTNELTRMGGVLAIAAIGEICPDAVPPPLNRFLHSDRKVRLEAMEIAVAVNKEFPPDLSELERIEMSKNHFKRVPFGRVHDGVITLPGCYPFNRVFGTPYLGDLK